MKASLRFIAFSSVLLTRNVLAAELPRCNSDEDCGKNAVCMELNIGRTTVKKCVGYSADIPVCGGRQIGRCPAPDAGIGDTICVFVKSSKLRNINCCVGKSPAAPAAPAVAAPAKTTPAVPTNATDANTTTPATTLATTPASKLATTPASTVATTPATAPAATTTTSTTAPATRRFLQAINATATVATSVAGTCLDCYPDPKSPNVTVSGEFKCVLLSQCKDKAAFPDSCEVGLTCATASSTGPDGSFQIQQLCNGNGNCAPIDSDDPIKKQQCICKPGYGGAFCDEIISSECAGDCGIGGVCTDNACVCNKGYTNDQCTGCTMNSTCNFARGGGYCAMANQTCVCQNGGNVSDPFCGNVTETDTTECASNCGNKGQCYLGQCVCISSCEGNGCKQCVKDDCSDCSFAITLQPFILMLVTLLLAAIVQHV